MMLLNIVIYLLHDVSLISLINKQSLI